MVNTTKELGPYIVIAPGVAIPHSRPEDGVISPCMAFVKLASPVEFGNKENDPVHLLFALGALDHEQHVDALRQIAEVLMDEKKSKKLFEAGSIQDITGVLYS
jgi:mannitol/fructose-specific phosphotransferase system IIA component (Ntr-type)